MFIRTDTQLCVIFVIYVSFRFFVLYCYSWYFWLYYCLIRVFLLWITLLFMLFWSYMCYFIFRVFFNMYVLFSYSYEIFLIRFIFGIIPWHSSHDTVCYYYYFKDYYSKYWHDFPLYALPFLLQFHDSNGFKLDGHRHPHLHHRSHYGYCKN